MTQRDEKAKGKYLCAILFLTAEKISVKMPSTAPEKSESERCARGGKSTESNGEKSHVRSSDSKNEELTAVKKVPNKNPVKKCRSSVKRT